ncbi:DUF1254 domain-containing protein [Oceanicoccus sagamiensis]|uniref:DUF1254 domain-containing protein n=1 Tax=Oceanicoccus sagamiensis TaxID=716816 RepID=A0A1X9NDU4_9GAMM|nr:DUF1254 domain-containing protein [Oceanicoccus sagamiensis]ARN75726.1 hypothetical protein BST96_17405 [Oceanicoccus sagamiensis]
MSWLRWIAFILICGWLGQYPLAMLVPHLVMERLYSKIEERISPNKLNVNPRPDETSRWVVRPSPDLLYASCLYNLEQGSVVITAPVTDRYWSMQFYQMNTDNFAGITNQRDEHVRIGTQVEVTLIGPEADPEQYSGEVIQSPTARGMMLIRASGIGDDTEAKAALELSRCSPGKDNQQAARNT